MSMSHGPDVGLTLVCHMGMMCMMWAFYLLPFSVSSSLSLSQIFFKKFLSNPFLSTLHYQVENDLTISLRHNFIINFFLSPLCLCLSVTLSFSLSLSLSLYLNDKRVSDIHFKCYAHVHVRPTSGPRQATSGTHQAHARPTSGPCDMSRGARVPAVKENYFPDTNLNSWRTVFLACVISKSVCQGPMSATSALSIIINLYMRFIVGECGDLSWRNEKLAISTRRTYRRPNTEEKLSAKNLDLYLGNNFL